MRNGADTLADYELLEMLLFYSIPRRDTKPLAKALLHRFGSLIGVLRASAPELLAMGINERGLRLMRFPAVVAERLCLAEDRLRPSIGNWEQLTAYLQATISSSVPNQFRLLYLDNRNRLLADEPVDDFSSTAAIFRRALALQAVALIGVQRALVAPHHAAAPLRLFANRLDKEAQLLSMTLHDVVVASNRRPPLSLRQKGLF